MAALSGLPNLVDLDLSNTEPGDEGLAKVADLKQLKILRLRRCGMTDAGLEHLVALENLEQLHLLYNSSNITDAGMEPVGKLPNLRLLDLRGCTLIGDAGLEHLKSLKNLDKSQNPFIRRL